MTHANGDIYEGNWQNDKACGYGVFVDTVNAKYEGYWLDDLQHGEGIESWGTAEVPQAIYIGNFFKGKKNGKGRFQWNDGSYYEGDFVDGHFQGFGRYYFADLDKYYEGEFRFSNMEGRGIETWNDGKRYEGDFKNGKKDGQGDVRVAKWGEVYRELAGREAAWSWDPLQFFRGDKEVGGVGAWEEAQLDRASFE
eukprot:CAMPEP_0170548592 /NCGR_PEP_ID=MMETSP0211-20121228/6870_1 /TAXON_ID=311385 /ORGANISM="Pseudokeronopsis sp., Strain OXSARD2" /LENGTH=194 /DNA_ID=CAMNT_0010854203 /DNA_START=510 /DNA_END=1090 /DNA_ORIENTATION=-